MIAFDTGPGNMIIDALAVLTTDGAQAYDIDGALGGAGHASSRELLAAWLADPYFCEAAAENDRTRAVRRAVRPPDHDRVARTCGSTTSSRPRPR